mmetsp:Transcript_61322/g.143537  ORF Transcript_61322/g.143537 Transcript_61322/m.143537 type:complete len:228 (-) Transcript_61322:1707-2390(-)
MHDHVNRPSFKDDGTVVLCRGQVPKRTETESLDSRMRLVKPETSQDRIYALVLGNVGAVCLIQCQVCYRCASLLANLRVRHMVLHAEDDKLNTALAANCFSGDLELPEVREGAAALSLNARVRLEGFERCANQGDPALVDDRLLHGLHPRKDGQDLAPSLLDACFCRKGAHDRQDEVQQTVTDVDHLRRRMWVTQCHSGLQRIEHHGRILSMNLQYLDNPIDGKRLD